MTENALLLGEEKEVFILEYKECEGCSSHDELTMAINGGSNCVLKPKFNGKQCPCVTCLVKCMCTETDYDCEAYYNFAKLQYNKSITEEKDIPCKKCDQFSSCVEKIVKLRIEQYGENPDYIDEDQDYSFQSEIMCLLTRECKDMDEYFPFDVASRDGLMVQSICHYRHEKATKRQNMEENEWHRRFLMLYHFFLEYNVKTTEWKEEAEVKIEREDRN